MTAGFELGPRRGGGEGGRGAEGCSDKSKSHFSLAQQLSDSEEQGVSRVRKQWRSLCVFGEWVGADIPSRDRVHWGGSKIFRPGNFFFHDLFIRQGRCKQECEGHAL